MIVPIEEVLENNWLTGRDIGDGDGLVEPEGAAIDVRLGEIWEMDTDSEAFLIDSTYLVEAQSNCCRYRQQLV